jgi:hypothetical protein
MFMCAQCQNTIADASNFDVNQFFWTNYLSPSEYVQRMQMEQGGNAIVQNCAWIPVNVVAHDICLNIWAYDDIIIYSVIKKTIWRG